MLITRLPICFNCSRKYLSVANGDLLPCVQHIDIVPTMASTITSAHVNYLIDVSSRKQKSMCINSPGLRLDVSIVIPFGKFTVLAFQHITHLHFCFLYLFYFLFGRSNKISIFSILFTLSSIA